LDLGALTGGFLTGLREGVEAALIVAIVLAYLARTGNLREAPKVWIGTAAAILVSLVAGVVIFQSVGALPEPYEQLFEAATLLIAATVVTWMLFWMRRQSAALRGDLHARLERVLTEGTVFGLAILAFSAVIREGLETALFLVGQATAAASGAGSVLLGALLGLAGAVVIGWIFYTGSRRIDLRSFFRWTGIGLVYLAAGLVSRAPHELVEIGAIPFGSQTAFDLSAVLPHESGIGQFLRAILGYSATPEVTTLVVYVAYLVIVLGLYLRPVASPPAPTKTAETAGSATQGVRS
jgi:high-affinity iron transporter